MPEILQRNFRFILHNYHTKSNLRNFKESRLNLKTTKFVISFCIPRLWYKMLENVTKTIKSPYFLSKNCEQKAYKSRKINKIFLIKPPNLLF